MIFEAIGKLACDMQCTQAPAWDRNTKRTGAALLQHFESIFPPSLSVHGRFYSHPTERSVQQQMHMSFLRMTAILSSMKRHAHVVANEQPALATAVVKTYDRG